MESNKSILTKEKTKSVISKKKKKVRSKESKLLNANFPKTDEGRVYHVGVKRGEVANRIITVGDPDRAEFFVQWLDKDTPIFRLKSRRGFLTITGKYKGVPISMVGIGMGLPMMDFFVREVRSVVDGQLAIIRFGSCGSIGPANLGSLIVSSGSYAITRNYNYCSDIEEEEDDDDDDDHTSTAKIEEKEKPYNFTKITPADPELCEKIESKLSKVIGKEKVFTGLNATCDSFYSSQGRHDDNFRDCNSDLFSNIIETYPDTISLEMETFMLYYLAKITSSTPLLKDSNVVDNDNSIKAAATMMVFADRIKNEFINIDNVGNLQEIVGKALLDVLVEIELNQVHPDSNECVWNRNLNNSRI